MRIFLIGYMGSGKTTIGKKIAAQMGFQFIDQDDLIQEMAGMTIPEIFQNEGEDGFRKWEHLAIKQVIDYDNVVVATGGGAPCFFNNMQLYNANGVTIYLKMKPEVLAIRLMDSATERPLIKGKSKNELVGFIYKSLAEREKYYNLATFVIEGVNVQVKDILNVLGLSGFGPLTI